MIASHQNPFASYTEHDDFYSRWSTHALADKIGGELRDLYSDLTVDSQPDDLLKLARLIDERREAGSQRA